MADQSLLAPVSEMQPASTPVETFASRSTLLHWLFMLTGTPKTSPRAQAPQFRALAMARVAVDAVAWISFAGAFGIRTVSFNSSSVALLVFTCLVNSTYVLIPVTTVVRYLYLASSSTPSRHVLPSQVARMQRMARHHYQALALLFCICAVFAGVVGYNLGKLEHALLLCAGTFAGGILVLDLPLLATSLLLAAECGRLRDGADALLHRVTSATAPAPRGDQEAPTEGAGAESEEEALFTAHADLVREADDASGRARSIVVVSLLLCLSLAVQALVEVYVHSFSVASPSFEDLAHTLVVIVLALVAGAAGLPMLWAMSAINAVHKRTLPALATASKPSFPLDARARLLACFNASPLEWDIVQGYPANAGLLWRTVLGAVIATVPAAVRAGMSSP